MNLSPITPPVARNVRPFPATADIDVCADLDGYAVFQAGRRVARFVTLSNAARFAAALREEAR